MRKNNPWQIIILPIILFLLIDQLVENYMLFNGLNLIYKNTGIGQSNTQFLFKLGEMLIVLGLNYVITKQPMYFQRCFTKWDWGFWIFVIIFLLLRVRSVTANQLLPSLLVGLAGGFPEELMVRGVIMGKLMTWFAQKRSSYGTILLAVVISDAIFGLLHLNNIGQYPLSYVLTQVFVAFGGGLVYSALYVRTGSLWYPIVLHFLYDFVIEAGGGSSSGGSLDFAAAREFAILYIVMGIIGYLIILPPWSKRTPALVSRIKNRQNNN